MRRKRWVPLMLIWLGVIWLVQIAAYAGGRHGVWIIGEQADLGVLVSGEVVQRKIYVVNLSFRGLEVEVLPSCGCTVLEESRLSMGALGWKGISVRVDGAGLGVGVHSKVLRLRFRRGAEQWEQDVLLRFTVRQLSPSEGVKR